MEKVILVNSALLVRCVSYCKACFGPVPEASAPFTVQWSHVKFICMPAMELPAKNARAQVQHHVRTTRAGITGHNVILCGCSMCDQSRTNACDREVNARRNPPAEYIYIYIPLAIRMPSVIYSTYRSINKYSLYYCLGYFVPTTLPMFLPSFRVK